MKAPKQDVLIKREKAGEKTKKRQRKIQQIQYEVKDNDVFILSGPYLGRTVKELWSLGPLERDWLVQHLWFTNDLEVVKIIHSLCA